MTRKKMPGFTMLIFVFLAAACSVSKEAHTMKHSINGNWTLQTVDVQGINGKIATTVFNEADIKCFTGSTWTFISNNSLGTYQLSSAAGCPSVTRNIRWSVYEPKGEEKKFQFKRLDEKKNPMDDNDGYRLSVASLSDTNMQLTSAITFEGKPATIVYNFVKN